ncbi:MAG: hypothetical protein CVV51_02405 [Spirochaetae bacterium HGW-Spirochaetae-7]|jgi:hypothetical protein|nr:MAG: hypothetical protein CVV51_02405 [Spirochaetae bacterium HGW-Spirochaetae-7]
MPKSSRSKFLQGARTLVENAAGLPEMSSVLSGYGYTEARFKEGLDLVDAADSLSKRTSLEYGEKMEASAEFSGAWATANVVYSKTLKLARIALGDDPKGVAALRLMGTRKQSFSGWYDQAGTFYENMLGDKRFTDGLAVFGYTKDRLRDEKKVVDDVMKKYTTHAYESGSAQASTAERDRKLKELDSWVSDLRGVCEVAFYDTPDELEKLGPLAPTRRRAATGKKKPAVVKT